MVAEPDIAVIGPMARSAFDLELQLDIVAGADDFEPGVRYELPGLPEAGVAGLRVGVWANDAACPVSRETEGRVHLVAEALRGLGATVDLDAKPDLTGAESDAVYRPPAVVADDRRLAQGHRRGLEGAGGERGPG